MRNRLSGGKQRELSIIKCAKLKKEVSNWTFAKATFINSEELIWWFEKLQNIVHRT